MNDTINGEAALPERMLSYANPILCCRAETVDYTETTFERDRTAKTPIIWKFYKNKIRIKADLVYLVAGEGLEPTTSGL